MNGADVYLCPKDLSVILQAECWTNPIQHILQEFVTVSSRGAAISHYSSIIQGESYSDLFIAFGLEEPGLETSVLSVFHGLVDTLRDRLKLISLLKGDTKIRIALSTRIQIRQWAKPY